MAPSSKWRALYAFQASSSTTPLIRPDRSRHRLLRWHSALLAAALIMFFTRCRQLRLPLVSFSTMLLAMAMLHLLPEAMEMGLTPHQAFPLLLVSSVSSLYSNLHSGATRTMAPPTTTHTPANTSAHRPYAQPPSPCARRPG